MRVVMERHVGVALACLFAVTAGFAPYTAGGSGVQAQPTLPRPPCIAQPGASLTARDLGAFTLFLSGTMTHLNLLGEDPGRPSLMARTVRLVAVHGFLANLTLHGFYRRLNDETFRRLGYPIGKWPYMPFAGRVVQDHPGCILEVYQDNSIYSSPAPAPLSAWRGCGRCTFLREIVRRSHASMGRLVAYGGACRPHGAAR